MVVAVRDGYIIINWLSSREMQLISQLYIYQLWMPYIYSKNYTECLPTTSPIFSINSLFLSSPIQLPRTAFSAIIPHSPTDS